MPQHCCPDVTKKGEAGDGLWYEISRADEVEQNCYEALLDAMRHCAARGDSHGVIRLAKYLLSRVQNMKNEVLYVAFENGKEKAHNPPNASEED